MPLANLAIEDFISDDPPSLTPFGLDRATRVFLQTGPRVLDLLIGNEAGGSHYAKLSGAPGVFTLAGMHNVINARPFDLIDKFPILVHIDTVDSLTVTSSERRFTANFEGAGHNAIFYLNGRRAEERSFRSFYQAVIGLLVDADYLSPGRLPETYGAINIEFLLHSPAGERVSITLLPYNRDFYILRQNGVTEFLISRSQVHRIFQTADAVVFE